MKSSFRGALPFGNYLKDKDKQKKERWFNFFIVLFVFSFLLSPFLVFFLFPPHRKANSHEKKHKQTRKQTCASETKQEKNKQQACRSIGRQIGDLQKNSGEKTVCYKQKENRKEMTLQSPLGPVVSPSRRLRQQSPEFVLSVQGGLIYRNKFAENFETVFLLVCYLASLCYCRKRSTSQSAPKGIGFAPGGPSLLDFKTRQPVVFFNDGLVNASLAHGIGTGMPFPVRAAFS